MKVNRYICLSLALLMMIAAVSCSADFGQNVYYGGISGIVKDKDSSNGVSGVKVYLYTSESERDAAFSIWEDNGGLFSDKDCLYKATTDSNGKWTVSKVVWMAKDGAWGSDYDHIPVYIIYFSEDYGCWKEEEKIELVSGTSNTNAIESKREKIKTTSKLTINFRENNKAISDEITFTYSYNDGYSDIKKDVSTINGQFVIDSLSYVKNDDGAVVTISNIMTTNGCWNTESLILDPNDSNISQENGVIKIKVNKASVTSEIKMNRTKYDFGENGISGRITASREVVTGSPTGTSVEHSLDSLVVVAIVNDGTTYSVLTGNGNYDSDTALSFSVDFSGLAVNEKLEKGASGTTIDIKVYSQDGTTELGSTTLDLDSHYESKNSVNIMVSWT